MLPDFVFEVLSLTLDNLDDVMNILNTSKFLNLNLLYAYQCYTVLSSYFWYQYHIWDMYSMFYAMKYFWRYHYFCIIIFPFAGHIHVVFEGTRFNLNNCLWWQFCHICRAMIGWLVVNGLGIYSQWDIHAIWLADAT